MANRPQNFKLHDVRRAIRAAQAEGLANPSVRIRVPSGTEFYVSGGAVEAPKKKASKQHDADFAEGGESNRMAGRGDRTKTDTEDSAGPQTAGRTGSISKNNPKFAGGGGKKEGLGGIARPARGGQTGC